MTTKTTVITRLYASKYSAKDVQNRLLWHGYPRYLCWVLSGEDDAARSKIATKLREIGVDGATVTAYENKMTDESGLLVVQAGYRPLNAKRIAFEAIAESKPEDMGSVTEEVVVKETASHAPSIFKSHPRIMTMDPHAVDAEGRPVSMAYGIPLLLAAPKRDSAISGGQTYTGGWWPLVKDKPRKKSVFEGGRMMAGGRVSRKPRKNSVIRGGDLPFSRALGWSPISK